MIEPLWRVECAWILHVLEHFKGNRSHAAKALGISIRTLRNKIDLYKKMKIQVPESVGPYLKRG
jgi:DNA-binding NtrC family response regulator